MKYLILLAVVGVCVAQNAHSEFAKVFDSDVDKNKNGRADLSEFERIFYSYDLNKDNKVPVAEYIKVTGGVGTGPATFFSLIDPNTDGTITKAELPAILAKFDGDGDGIVTESEFIKEYSDLFKKVTAMQISVGK